MTIDIEPAPPANAEWVADWDDDESGLHRYYCEAEYCPIPDNPHLGVKVVGFQNFDGSERGRMVYLRGVGELSVDDARALAQELLEAASRV